MTPLPPPDLSLPGLPIALDGDAMGEVLSRCLPDCASGRLEVVKCLPVYVRYKPGTSCLVGYGLLLQDAQTRCAIDTFAHARLYADGRAESVWSSRSFARLVERAARRHPEPPTGRAAYAPAIGALVQVYPVDAELPALVRAASPSKMRRLLAEALPHESGQALSGVQPRLVRYKPGRKALLHYELARAGQLAAYAKLQTHDRGADHFRVSSDLREAGIRTPAPLAYLPELRMLVHEETHGARLADLRCAPAFGEWMAPAAEALAHLHSTRLASLPRHSLLDEAGAVLAAAHAITTLLPRIREETDRLARDIASGLAEVAAQFVTVHGDFYDDQILVGGGGIALIDFEEARLGHPLLDVGNFLAHQSRWEDPSGPAREAFLDAYRRSRPGAPHGVLLFEAAALLKLAIGPFRRLEPGWPESVERLVRLAGTRMVEHERDRRSVPGHTELAVSLYTSQTAAGARGDGDAGSADALATAGNLVSRRELIADPAMPQLATLQDRTAMEEVFSSEAYRQPVQLLGLEIVRHKPGRRCILRYDLKIGRAGALRRECVYGKTFASERGPRVHGIISMIAAARACGPEAQLPDPVAYLPSLKLLVQREVSGEPLARMLLAGDERVARRVADAVYALHSSGLELGRRHGLDAELLSLQGRVENLCAAWPALAPLARRCLEAVLRGPGNTEDWRWRPAHRDFYHDQVLAGAHGLSVLDFDDAAMSEPAVDVANFLAHLRLLSLQAYGTPGALAPVAVTFLDRYEALDPVLSPSLVRFLEGATLLRLAEIHSTRRRGEWMARRLLEESRRLLFVTTRYHPAKFV